MIRIFSILALGLLTLSAQAQTNEKVWGETPADSTRCWENYNIFGSLFNGKSYVEAYDAWNIVYTTCPAAKEVVYIYGPVVVEAKIQATGDTAARRVLIDQLLEMYDTRLRYFPGKEAYVKAAKAHKMYEYYPERRQEIFNLFEEALAIDEKELTAAHINAYFMVAVKLYQEDVLNLVELFDMYNKISESVTSNTDLLNKEFAELKARKMDSTETLTQAEERTLHRDSLLLVNFGKVKGNIDKALKPILTSCEKIAIVYNKESFERHRTDEVWLRRAVRTLGATYKNEEGEDVSCRDNPLYFELTEALYALNPSTEAARNMGRLAWSREDYQKTIQYYNEAIEGEMSPVQKADDYLKVAYAQQKLGQFAASKATLLRAASLNSASGEAYLQLSTLYAAAAGQCGEDAFEKNAVYWAAINRAEQAKSIEPGLSNRANRAIASYKRGVPDKSVSFRLGHKEGEEYTVGCWINEKVTVRFYE